jgi:hypothetical protein
MTEEAQQAVSSGQGMSQQQAPAPQAPVAERTLTQSEVDRLIGEKKAAAYERGRQDALSEHQRSVSTQQSTPTQHQQSVGGMPQLTEQQIRQMIADNIAQENARAKQETYAANIVQNLMGKVEAAKKKFPDIEQKLAGMGLEKMPEVLGICANFDNAAEILLHLRDNPLKKAGFLTLATHNPQEAYTAMAELAQSLRQNDTPRKEVDAPLSQMKASPVGMDNGEPESIDYFKSQDWLRG